MPRDVFVQLPKILPAVVLAGGDPSASKVLWRGGAATECSLTTDVRVTGQADQVTGCFSCKTSSQSAFSSLNAE